jgi:uncharacterized protein
MKILITGASGLVGSALGPFLEARENEVVRLSRSPARGAVRWDPERGEIDVVALEGVDAVVHLAGAGIADGRWTEARRRVLRSSRIDSTRLIVDALARLGRPPRVFVCASATGWYGDTGEVEVDETGSVGGGFLAGLCREWEAEAARAGDLGVRAVMLRTGVVLSPAGGALARLLPVFRAGLGGPAGNGRQWMSWISLDDLLAAVAHVLACGSLEGPVNAVGPQAVRNREFAQTLGRVLGRPALLATPALALRVMFGQMADETILASARVIPRRLRESGFQFLHPALEGALRRVLGR